MATLYAAKAQSQTTSDLYTIDPVTGTPTPVGPIGYAVTAMAWDPVGGVMYGVTSNNSAASPRNLITINLGTGAGTVVGALGLGATSSSSDITFTSDGQLWGIRTSNGRLLSINKTTGAGAEIGSAGGFGGSLVTTDDDQFVGIGFNDGNWFYWVVPQTGGQDKVAGDAFGVPSPFGNGGASVGEDLLVYIANAVGTNAHLVVADLNALTVDSDVSSLTFIDSIAWDAFFTLAISGPTPPTVVTGVADNLASDGARLNGTVNPEGIATTYQFDYGTTTGYGTSTTPASAGSGSSPVAESQTVTGLAPSTLYHFRIQATNAGGTTLGADATFTTPCEDPDLRNKSVAELLCDGVTVDFEVQSNSADNLDYWIEVTDGVTTISSPHLTDGSGASWTAVSSTIAGLLSPSTFYTYRCFVSTPCAADIIFSSTGNFTTPACPLGPFGQGACLLDRFTGPNCTTENWSSIAGDGIRLFDNQATVLHTTDPFSAANRLDVDCVGSVDIYATLAAVSDKQYIGTASGSYGAPSGYAAVANNDDGTAQVVRFDTGTLVVLGTVSATFNDGDKLGFRYDAVPDEVSCWQWTGTGPWVELVSAPGGVGGTYLCGWPFLAMSNVPFDTDITPYLFDIHQDIPNVGGRDCPIGSGPFFGEIGPHTGFPCFWNDEGLDPSLPVYDWSSADSGPRWDRVDDNPISDCPVWLARMGITAHGRFDYYNDSWGWGWFDLGDGLYYYLVDGATWNSVFTDVALANGFFVYDGSYTFFVGPSLTDTLDNLVAAFGDATKFESGSFPGETRTDAFNVWRPVTPAVGRFDDLFWTHCPAKIASFDGLRFPSQNILSLRG